MATEANLSREELLRVRDDFPALRQYVWFQNGGVSITPRPVAERHAALMRELYERGPLHIVYPDEEYPRRRASVARIARFCGAAPDELALMRGVSEAYLTVLRGIDWQPGDEIVLTEDEEAALLLPSLHLRDRVGVRVVKVPLCADPAEQVAAFAARLSERTRLVAISEVTTDVGFRLPVATICALARERGALSFLDLAHAVGLWPYDLHALGCDFAGLLSYKWMYAPYAAGALYVRRERLDALAVTYAGGRAERWLDFEGDAYALHDSAERFQFGPWSWPLIHAWAAALDYLDGIGIARIWARTAALTDRLKAGLLAIPGLALYTPLPAEQSAALVTFGLAGWSGEALRLALRERWNVIIKPLPHGREGLRTSVPFFLLEEEIDLLVAALRTLATEN